MTSRVTYLSAGARAALAVLFAAGAVAFALGLLRRPDLAWASFLTAAFYFVTLALGALVFLAMGHVGHAGWSAVLKRIAEAQAAWLPTGALTIGALLLGVHHLYHWSHPQAIAADPILRAKADYLNLPFFAVRMAIALGLWIGFWALFRRFSLRQDAVGVADARPTRAAVAASAAFLFLFAISFSMASIDWVMSLEPHWTSTIFGLYNVAGVLVAGVAGLTAIAIILRRRGLLPAMNDSHLHDLGKCLFAFSTVWAYLWFSQYMLIWYANIPEETGYYRLRTAGGWGFLFYLNLIAGWLLPFLVLLPRRAKRSEGHVFRVALWLLGSRWLDVYLMVTPPISPQHAGIGALDVAVTLGFAAAYVLVLARALGGAPLVPRGDPYLVESLHHHG